MSRFNELAKRAEEMVPKTGPARPALVARVKEQLNADKRVKTNVMLGIGADLATACASAISVGLDPLDCLEALLDYKKVENKRHNPHHPQQ